MIAKLEENRVIIRDCYDVKDQVRTVLGAIWDRPRRLWTLPLSEETVELLKQYCFPIDPPILEAWELKKSATKQAADIKTNKLDISKIPMKSIKNCTPYLHQVRGYLLGLANDNYCYALDMGTGKSLIMIAVMGERFRRGQVKRVVIVCPKSLMFNWQRELEKYANFEFTSLVLTGKLTTREENLRAFRPQNGLGIVIINYEIVDLFLSHLKFYGGDMYILDECQKIKNPSTKVSKALQKLGDKVPYRYVLSGTIIQNKVIDIFSVYKFMDKDIYGSSYHKFKMRYCEIGGFGGMQIIGYKNMEEFKEKFHAKAFRATKAEVLDLPDQLDQDLIIEFTPGSLAERSYIRIKKEMYASLESGDSITAPNALTKLLRLQQLCGGFIKTDEGVVRKMGDEKIGILKELLIQFVQEEGQKVVIFCRFLAEFNAIKFALEFLKIGFVSVNGDVSAEQRDWTVDQFQTNNFVRVFLGQIQCVSTGLTLTKAHTCIYYSMSFNFADYDQSRARIHRISQEFPCLYIHMLIKGSVDEYILQKVREKKSISDDILDDWRRLAGEL